jgi:hypothetical protein
MHIDFKLMRRARRMLSFGSSFANCHLWLKFLPPQLGCRPSFHTWTFVEPVRGAGFKVWARSLARERARWRSQQLVRLTGSGPPQGGCENRCRNTLLRDAVQADKVTSGSNTHAGSLLALIGLHDPQWGRFRRFGRQHAEPSQPIDLVWRRQRLRSVRRFCSRRRQALSWRTLTVHPWDSPLIT